MTVSKKTTCPCCDSKITYKQYLKTSHWQAKRREVLEWAGHSCQLCNSKKILHVHHRNYDNLWNEQLSDLIVLCKKCHEKHHDIEPLKEDIQITPKPLPKAVEDILKVFDCKKNKIPKGLFLEWVHSQNMPMANVLNDWGIIELDNVIELTRGTNSFTATYFDEPERFVKLQKLCCEYFGNDIEVRILNVS